MVLVFALIFIGVNIIIFAVGLHIVGTAHDTPELKNRTIQVCSVVLGLIGTAMIGFGVKNL